MTQPADPGFAATDDGCTARWYPPGEPAELDGFRCELDAAHVDRAEPHTITLVWFDPSAEPNCGSCADTGVSIDREGDGYCPDNCAAAQRLRGATTEDGASPAPDPENPAAATTAGATTHLGRWGDE